MKVIGISFVIYPRLVTMTTNAVCEWDLIGIPEEIEFLFYRFFR